MDGLRGLLAVIVCFYHGIWVLHRPDTQNVLSTPAFALNDTRDVLVHFYLHLLNGDFAVVVFFVMSGAVLQLALQASPQPLWLKAVEFGVARVLRIYPALIATLLLFWGSFTLLERTFPQTFKVYFTQAELWDNLLLRRIAMYGASWSIQVEIVLAPFIFLAFVLQRAFGVFALVGIAAWAMVLQQNPTLLFDWQVVTGHLLPFALGFMVTSEIGSMTAHTMRTNTSIVVVVALILLRAFVPYAAWGAMFLHALCAYLIVAAIYHQSWPKIASLLSRGPMRFLGRISYSFYLLNPIFLQYFSALSYRYRDTRPEATYLGWAAAIGVAAVICTIPLAYVSERYIEKPFIRLGKALFGRPTPSIPPVTAQ